MLVLIKEVLSCIDRLLDVVLHCLNRLCILTAFRCKQILQNCNKYIVSLVIELMLCQLTLKSIFGMLLTPLSLPLMLR